jgi:hypothetical protein
MPPFADTHMHLPPPTPPLPRKSILSDRPAVILTAFSCLIAILLILAQGGMFYAVALIALVLILLITFYRLDWGFLLFIGMVMLFDQYPPRGYESSIIGTEYFENLKGYDIFSRIDWAVANPLELHLFLIIGLWILLIVMRKKLNYQRVPFWQLAALFFGWLLISLIYGMETGGDFLPALWELRSLFYMGIMFFFVPQIIQNPEQVRAFIRVCLAAISFKALQGIVRIVRLGFDFGGRTELTNHEDPLFFVGLFILFFALSMFDAKIRERTILRWSVPIVAVIFVLAQRRATYGAFGIAFIAFCSLLTMAQFRRVLRYLVPGLVLLGVYLVIFWNNETGIGLPAQLIKSSFSSTQETAGERYYSNLYREFENYNLAQTIQRSPVVGIGFGNKYDQPISLVMIPFTLRDYISHNEIFWLIVKSGGIGFFLFWLFLDILVMYWAHIYMRMTDPFFKSVCVMAIVAVFGQIIVSFYDLQLTYSRNMVFLGAMMGLLPTLEKIANTTKTAEGSAAR